MLIMFVPNFAYAEYPDLLNGDRNVVITGGHMGYGVYLVRNSIQIVNYNENGIMVKFDTIGVSNADSENRVINSRNTNRFFYKKNECAMYQYSASENKWRYIKPVGSMAETGHYYPGELAYCYLFGKQYYGGRYSNAACGWIYNIYQKYR